MSRWNACIRSPARAGFQKVCSCWNTITFPLPTFFPFLHRFFVHAEMVRKFVPNRIRNNLRSGYSIFSGGLFYRLLVQRNCVGKRCANAVFPAARGKRDALIQAEQRLVVSKPLLFPDLARRLIFNKNRDVFNFHSHPLRQQREPPLNEALKFPLFHRCHHGNYFLPPSRSPPMMSFV